MAQLNGHGESLPKYLQRTSSGTNENVSVWPYKKTNLLVPIESNMNLIVRIVFVSKYIREKPGAFANVRQSLFRRGEACIIVGERSFEQFFW